MSEYRLIVTQRVAYDNPGDSLEEILTSVQNGTWDTGDNDVLHDRVQVYDGDRLVYDTDVRYEVAEDIPGRDTVTIRVSSEHGVYLYEVARQPITLTTWPGERPLI